MRRWLSEPLLHFLAAGALIFAVYSMVAEEGRGDGAVIVVGEAQVDSLVAVFERTWRRTPTPDEIRVLIDGHVREEILYREGRTLGLDRDDPLVRRRVRQKLEFLNESMNPVAGPDDAQLQAYLDKHPGRYAAQAQLSFRQVYLGELQEAAATASPLLAQLGKVGDSDAAARFGKPTQLDASMKSVPVSDVERTFGPGFAQALAAMPTGTWQGPVASSYGLHLVLVNARTEPGPPRLSEVREVVVRDWMREQLALQNDKYYERLRARYTIRIQSPTLAAAQ